ncbi:MAG: response regulator [Betaproteobacteria bacterium]|nr:response regulator [Betaproteobacteria bacterium]
MAKILVVEDENDIRNNLRRFLQLEGHEVIEAENGRRGVEQALAQLPELIICDLMMPELDGFAVLREVRGNPLTRHIAFCFLTASAEKDTRYEGLAQGADEYMTKPFNLAELRELITRMLMRRRGAVAG